MNIAVDINELLNNQSGGKLNYALEIFSLLAEQKKNRIYFLKENEANQAGLPGSNVEFISYGSDGKFGLLRKLGLKFQLSGILKRIKADVLISFGVAGSASLPQILVINEGMQIKTREIKKATLIVVNTREQKNELEKTHKTPAKKIEIVPVALNESYQPVQEEGREKIKAKYCSGKEYFICTACEFSSDSFTNLLKSFSHFKKRQQSSMCLVLLAKPGAKNLKNLSAYKYRNDVAIIESIRAENEGALIGSCYAVIIKADDNQPVLNTLKAMQCGVPVIASDNSAVREIAGDAALYGELEAVKEIGEKMIRLYADEELRNQLIKKGITIAAGYTQQRSADSMWNCICKALK